MKSKIRLFGRADGRHPAFNIMVGDAKKILGLWAMPTLADTGVLCLALDGAILSLQCKRVLAGSARFRPPCFALEKNRVVFGTFGFYGKFPRLSAGLLGAGCALGRKIFKLTRSIGVNRFSAATINIHEGE